MKQLYNDYRNTLAALDATLDSLGTHYQTLNETFTPPDVNEIKIEGLGDKKVRITAELGALSKLALVKIGQSEAREEVEAEPREEIIEGAVGFTKAEIIKQLKRIQEQIQSFVNDSTTNDPEAELQTRTEREELRARINQLFLEMNEGRPTDNVDENIEHYLNGIINLYNNTPKLQDKPFVLE
jgi:hypothetical protein